MDVREEDVFPPAPDDVVQDKMLNWVIRGVTLDQSYKKEDYIPIKPDRFKGLQQFTYSAGAHPEAYPIDVYVYKLGGLEYATDLRKIDLSYNMVSDLTPLKDLTNLRDLTFYMNKLTSIEPLRKLTNLEQLNIAFNEVKDLSPLTNMKSLKNLNVENTGISDLRGIERCTKLSSLNLSGNKVSDISALENLTNMEEFLWLNNNQITDISALADMTKLRELDLYGNQVSDVSALKNLRNLESLNLGNNREIADLAPLVNLTNLKEDEVNLVGTKIETKKELLFEVIRVNKLIDRFNANEISVVDKGKVEEARKAYDRLSDEAKSYITELRITAAEGNIARLEQGKDLVHYDELSEFENMAKQDVKTLEIRVTDKNGDPVRHARFNVKGQRYGEIYGTISTDKYGLAEYTIPSNNNETSYTFKLQESAKFTGDTADIEITLSADSVITHINGEATEDGKIDRTLTLKAGAQLSVNKVTLEKLIASAEKISADEYSDVSYSKLTKAIEDAKAVVKNSSATQKDVDEAEASLRSAMDNLEKGADMRTLKMSVEDGEGNPIPNIHFEVSNSWNGGRTELISNESGKMSYTVPKYPINYYTVVINADENYTMVNELRFSEEENKIVKVNNKTVTGPEDLNVTVTLKKKENLKPVDKSALEELIQEAEAIVEEDYTEDSYTALQKAIEEAKKVVADDSASQVTVNSQKSALQKAIDNLVAKEVKPTDRKTAVIIAKDGTGKPVEGVKFTGYSTYGSNVNKVTDSRGAIEYSMKRGETLTLHLEDDRYTTTSGEIRVKTDWETGEIISINDKAITTLEEQIVNVVVNKVGGESSVDKSDLEAKLAEALKVDSGKYTEDSYNKLLAAIEEAQKVFDRDDAAQDEVTEQVNKLTTAMDNLKEKEEGTVDTTPLKDKLKEAKAISAKGYTADTYAALQDAIEKAEGVLNSNPSQQEVFTAVIDLQKAIDNLKKAVVDVNKDLLGETLEKAKSYKADDWTKASYEALQKAIAEAEAVYKDEEADQVAVDRKVAALNKAINNLEAKGSETPNPEKPEKPEKPNTPNTPGTGGQGGQDGNGNAAGGQKPDGTVLNGGTSGPQAAKTADTAHPIVYAAAMFAAMAGIVVFRRKKVK